MSKLTGAVAREVGQRAKAIITSLSGNHLRAGDSSLLQTVLSSLGRTALQCWPCPTFHQYLRNVLRWTEKCEFFCVLIGDNALHAVFFVALFHDLELFEIIRNLKFDVFLLSRPAYIHSLVHDSQLILVHFAAKALILFVVRYHANWSIWKHCLLFPERDVDYNNGVATVPLSWTCSVVALSDWRLSQAQFALLALRWARCSFDSYLRLSLDLCLARSAFLSRCCVASSQLRAASVLNCISSCYPSIAQINGYILITYYNPSLIGGNSTNRKWHNI